MAKTIKAVVNTGLEETTQSYDIVQGAGDKGNPTRIKAIKGVRYQLEDPAAKNTGPDNIRTKRVGKNLHVLFEDSKEADLIVEGYFEESTQSSESGLYGRAEDGNLYQYVTEDAASEGALVDGGRPVYQVLGGNAVGEEFALSSLPVASSGISALTAGAGAAGAAAAAGAGGGGGGAGTAAPSTDTTTQAQKEAAATDAVSAAQKALSEAATAKEALSLIHI